MSFPLSLPSVLYCEQNKILAYSAHAEPLYDEAKGRVSKGKAGFRSVPKKGHHGWTPQLLMPDNADYTLVMCDAGTPSGLIIVDLDVTHEEVFGAPLLQRLRADCAYSVKTGSGGLHFYFTLPADMKWTKVLNNATFAGYDTKGQLDILANGTGVILAGSYFMYQNRRYEYAVEPNAQGNIPTMDDIGDMPEWLVEATAEVATKPRNVIIVTPGPEAEPPRSRSVSPIQLKPPRSRSVSPVQKAMTELKLIKELVKGCLPSDFFLTYDNWFRFICCLKSISRTEACKDICVAACAKPLKYKNAEARAATGKKWDEVKPDGRLTMGTLRYWCRAHNPAKYSEILKDAYEVLICGTVNDIAQMFALEMAGCVVLDPATSGRNSIFWRFSEDKRLWIPLAPEQLHTMFVEVMPAVIARVREDVLKKITCEETKATKSKRIGTIYSKVCNGIVESYLKPLSTLLNPTFTVANYKDAEFSLNDRPELLPLKNGVFNFSTGKLEKEYNREHFLSYRLDIDYNPDADTSDIEKAMYQWYEGGTPEGRERIAFMKYWLGYCLTGFNTRDEFMVVYGEAGGNGKSLLFEEILGRDIFGRQLFYSLAEDALSKTGGNNDSLYNLKGKRLCVLSEAGGKKGAFNVEALKKLTGKDAITASAKFKNEITFTPTSKVVMLTNKLPDLPAQDGGVARRYVCIRQNTPFVKPELYDKYSEEDKACGRVYPQDLAFVERLRANKEGWIKLLIEGALQYMANPTMAAPASVLEYSRRALMEGDIYSKWLEENLVITGLLTDNIRMGDISAEFLKVKGRDFNDTKSKSELITRLKRWPRLLHKGNQAKGRLELIGLRWRAGCDPADDEVAQEAQIKAYDAWLAGRSSTDALMTEFLTSLASLNPLPQ